MATTRISALDEITSLEATDVLPINDDTDNTTKKTSVNAIYTNVDATYGASWISQGSTSTANTTKNLYYNAVIRFSTSWPSNNARFISVFTTTFTSGSLSIALPGSYPGTMFIVAPRSHTGSLTLNVNGTFADGSSTKSVSNGGALWCILNRNDNRLYIVLYRAT